MSRSKNRKIADLISGTTFDDGVVAASEVTGLATVATSGSFSDLSNQPAAFDPATLASVAVSGSFNDLSNQPTPFDPSTLATVATSGAYSALSGTPTLGTASTQATGAFATAAQGTTADAAMPKSGGTFTGAIDVTGSVTSDGLTVDGGNLNFMGGTNDAQYIKFGDTGDDDIGNILYYHGNNNMVFTANAAEAMRITASGIDVTGTVNADALTGIGSIDATTAAAIGNAGIGGDENFVLLSTTTVTSNVSTIDISLPTGYKKHFLEWRGILHTYTSQNRNASYGFTDSSGSMASPYLASASTYRNAAEGSADSNYTLLAGPQFSAGGMANVSEGLGVHWYMDITNARSALDTTMIYWRAAGPFNRYGGVGGVINGSYGNGMVGYPQDNPKIRFSVSGSSYHSQSGNILLWGVK